MSESDTSKTVTFSVFRPREADENKHQVSFHYLKGLNGSENIDPSLIEIVGINSVGKKYTFANDSINPLIFSNYINTRQNYDFEIRIKDENYVAVPSKFNVKVKHVDRDLSFQIYKKESPTETVDVKAKFEFEKSHAEEPNRKFAQLLIDVKELLDSQQSNRHLQGTRLEAFSENEVIFHNLPKYNQDHSEIKYSVQPYYERYSWERDIKMFNENWELDRIINEDNNPYNFVIKHKLSQKALEKGMGEIDDSTVNINITNHWKGDGLDINNLPEVYFQLMDGNIKVGDPKKLEKGYETVTWKNQPKSKFRRRIYYSVEMVNADGSPWKAENFEGGRIIRRGNTNEEDINSFNFSVTNSFIKKRGNRFITKEFYIR